MNTDSLITIDDRFQSPVPSYRLTEAERRQRVLEMSVGLLIERTALGETWTDGFADIDVFLEAIPLPTTDFRSAKGHLQNALAYCHVHEFGAAIFELRVVRGILQSL